MATFNLTVQGTIVLPLLGIPAQNSNSTQDTFTIDINSSTGLDVNIVITPDIGYTNFTVQLSENGGGFLVIPTNYTFTYTSTSVLRLILRDDNILDMGELEDSHSLGVFADEIGTPRTATLEVTRINMTI